MTKRIYIYLLFFLYAVSAVAAVAPKDSVQVVANWKKGERYTYQVNRSDREVAQGRVVNQYTSQATYSFHVLNATADSYTIRWTLEEIELSREAWNDPVVATILSFFEGVPIIYTTDNMGEFLEWRNWLEIKQKVPDIVAEILSNRIQDRTSRVRSQKFIYNILAQLFENREQAESSLLKEIIMLHGFHGYVYPLEEKTPYEDYIYSPYGQPIQANGFMRFHDFDTESGYVEADIAYALDENGFKKMMHGIMNKEGDEYPNMKMKNTKREHYLIDTYSGRVEKLTFSQHSISVIEGKERMKYEKVVIELIE